MHIILVKGLLQVYNLFLGRWSWWCYTYVQQCCKLSLLALVVKIAPKPQNKGHLLRTLLKRDNY